MALAALAVAVLHKAVVVVLAEVLAPPAKQIISQASQAVTTAAADLLVIILVATADLAQFELFGEITERSRVQIPTKLRQMAIFQQLNKLLS
jgi:hypothetical protein